MHDLHDPDTDSAYCPVCGRVPSEDDLSDREVREWIEMLAENERAGYVRASERLHWIEVRYYRLAFGWAVIGAVIVAMAWMVVSSVGGR